MVGIKEIASLAGVSAATVSNVLNERPNVGKETREKVLKICRDHNFYPDITGKNLKSGKTKAILFTFSDFNRSFYLEVIHGIHDYAYAHDYDLLISTGRLSEKYMHSRITCGCIALDSKLPSDVVRHRANEDYPIVILDRVVDSRYVKSILVNNYDSMYSLVSNLVKAGNSRFAYLGGPESTDDNKERYSAFHEALKDNGISFKRDGYIAGDWLEASGKRAAQILMLTPNRPEVLVCANDNMALGAIKTFKENGIEVGKDILVTGFDNNILAEYNNITTIDIPDYERGYLAAQALVQNIEDEINTDTFRINAKIIVRESAPIDIE